MTFFFLKEWTESPTRKRLIETGDAHDHPAWTPKVQGLILPSENESHSDKFFFKSKTYKFRI